MTAARCIRRAFDIETNGLLEKGRDLTLHTLVVHDLDTGEKWSCSNHPERHLRSRPGYTHAPLALGLALLADTDELWGHNIIKYDLPALSLICGFKLRLDVRIRDTMVLARLIWADIRETDFQTFKKTGTAPRYTIPGKLVGTHKLEAWGHRLNLQKGDYSEIKAARLREQFPELPKDAITNLVWASWDPEMQDYGELDVEVTAELARRILKKNYSAQAIDLETSVAILCQQMETNGFPFDEAGAGALYADLLGRRQELEAQLKRTFRPWVVDCGPVTPKVNNSKTGISKGVPYTKVVIQEFNPSSRQHVADRLKALYGWEPEEFTESGQPKIDEETLKGLEYPEAKLLVTYFTVEKRIGQVAEGNQAWLKVSRNGSIHGSINPNGAVSGRATHAFPNVAQVPKVKVGKDKEGNKILLTGEAGGWGAECRALFKPIPGWVLVGTDQSSLELRCLAHFMARYDQGRYGEIVCGGDIHTTNQQAAGLPTRDMAKTFIYALIYGAGPGKIGSIVGKGPGAGKSLKTRFLSNLPALGRLLADIEARVNQQRSEALPMTLKGMDGRVLHVRSPHSAPNLLLQSAGAIACKVWMVLLDQKLRERGLRHGWDGDYAFCAWVHDELQIAARTREIGETIGQLSIQCAAEAGEILGFRCPLTGEFKIGHCWRDTH